MSDEVTERPSYFNRKINRVEAIRVTSSNVLEVARWTGGEVVKSEASLNNQPSYLAPTGAILDIPSLDGALPVLHGEWVLKDEEGKFSVMENKRFQSEYAWEGPDSE